MCFIYFIDFLTKWSESYPDCYPDKTTDKSISGRGKHITVSFLATARNDSFLFLNSFLGLYIKKSGRQKN